MSDQAQPYLASEGPLRVLGQAARGIASVRGAFARPSAPAVIKAQPRLRAAIEVDLLPVTATERKLDRVLETVQFNATDGDWHAVARILKELEAARLGLDGLFRPYEPAVLAARCTAALAAEDHDSSPLLMELPYSDDLLEELELFFAEDPGNHVLAALVARTNLDAGWAKERCLTGRPARNAKQAHLDRVADILQRFDPLEHMSPILAEVQYFAALSAPDPASALAAAYEDWNDLDPASLSPHTTHAIHLLPGFGGSAQRLDSAARAAAERTEDVFGGGAYAAFYLSALPRDARLIATLDANMLVDGLIDLIAYDGGDPETINQFTAFLHANGRPRRRGIGRGEDAAAAAKRLVLWTAAREFAAGMAGIAEGVWGGAELARTALEQLYAPEIAAGQRLRLARDGLHHI